MFKRGQIAFFVILGIVLVSVASLIFFSGSIRKNLPAAGFAKTDFDLVKESIDLCMNDVVERYLFLFLAQGGSFSLSLDEGSITIPVKVFYQEGNSYVPTLESLEYDFSNVVFNTIPYCLSQPFPEFEITASEPIVSVDLKHRAAVVDVEYDIEIKSQRKQETQRIKRFSFSYSIEVSKYLDISRSIVADIQRDPDWIDMEALGRYPLTISVEPKSTEFYVYTLEDTFDEGKPLMFRFGVLHEEVSRNEQPYFVNLKDTYAIRAGKSLSQDINAIDPDTDVLYYSMSSDMPSAAIDGITGLLTFKTSIKDIGNHTLEIYADDGKGKWDKRTVTIIVTP